LAFSSWDGLGGGIRTSDFPCRLKKTLFNQAAGSQKFFACSEGITCVQ